MKKYRNGMSLGLNGFRWLRGFKSSLVGTGSDRIGLV